MATTRDRSYRRRKRYQARKREIARQNAPSFRAAYRHWLLNEMYDVGSGGKYDTPRNRRAALVTPEQNTIEWIGDWS